MEYVSSLLQKVAAQWTSAADFRVTELVIAKLSGCPEIAREENFVLYKGTDKHCLAMFGYEKSKKNYSLFVVKDENQSLALFSSFVSRLLPLAQVSKQIWSQLLLQKVCDTVRERPSWSVAHICAFLGFLEPLQLRHPTIVRDLNAIDDRGDSPLHIAIKGGDRKVVQELLLLGASVEAMNSAGETVFHAAARMSADLIKLLVARPTPSINNLSLSGESAIHVAALESKPECLDMLLINGADPSLTTSYRFPVHCAVLAGSKDCTEMLVRRSHGQLSVRDRKYGGTPLHWCKTKEMVDVLLDLGADVDAVSLTGDTPLHIMINYGRAECVRALLCREANANVPNHEGKTPLHLAIPGGDVSLIRCLIVFGAEVNAPDVYNYKPRHLAATCCCKNSDVILHCLHLVGAERCCSATEDCAPGCSFDGTHNGSSPDNSWTASLDTTSEEVFEELLHEAHLPKRDGVERSTPDSPGSTVDPTARPGYKVLCLDGGGIRGMVLIAMLMAIEKEVGKPISTCFDWISGTSTGGILALAMAFGKSARYALGMYFRLKDQVFFGSKPYKAENLESILKKEFGEHALMIAIEKPRVMVTTLVADRHPPEMHFFRNYEHPKNRLMLKKTPPFCDRLPLPSEVKVWEAARCSGAAPSFFRAALGRYLDGGLAANNPTLDTLTEIHEYNSALRILKRESEIRPIACVVSLGTGRMPVVSVKDFDLFRPEGINDVLKVFAGAQSLMRLVVEQATCSEGPPVARSSAWCSMIEVPFFRLSPLLSQEVNLDETKDDKLLLMLYETFVYINKNKSKLRQLASVITQVSSSL